MKSKTRIFSLILTLVLVLTSNLASAQSGKPKVQDVAVTQLPEKEKLNKDSLVSPRIPMNLDHQKYLLDLCNRKDLDYVKILAIIKNESGFNPNAVGKNTYGYMQIHKMHHANFAKNHKTELKPLDPYINLNWGTSMLENLYRSLEKEGFTGEALDRAVLSSYAKGYYGFKKTGEASWFINRVREHSNWIDRQYGNK